MATGSAWMIAGRWVVRGIGLVSTVILARLLTPADFGLVATAMLVIGALQVLAETGQRQAIIRMAAPERAHYDTAWTIGVLIGIAIALCLAVAAPITAAKFQEPRLLPIMGLLALRPLIQGFENIGLVDFQRQLDFRRDLLVMLLGKVGSFAVTILLAFTLRDWRALIGGTLTGAVLAVGLSFVFSPYRPRLALSKAGEIWSFSGWALVTSIAAYAGERVDHAVVAARLDPATMGAYTVGQELASLPTEELVVPPVRALFAVYARIAHDAAALRGHYLSALGFIAIVASSTSTGMALVAQDAVALLLGPQWQQAASLIPWFALAAGTMGIARSVNAVLMAAGHVQANAWRMVLFAAVLLAASVWAVGWRGAEGAAIARFAVTLAFAPLMLWLAMHLLAIPASAMAALLWRPILAALGMAGAVLLLHPHLPPVALLRLPLEAGIGAAAYALLLAGLWWLAGRPDGAERTLLKNLPGPLGRALRR
jgi:O-antigen/teichoic acid export membrane protein